MNIVSYGGGTDSTAMLIELTKRQINVDLILFADTGGEKPHTYKYIKLFNDWLIKHDMPEITIVQKVRRSGELHTLEENCLECNMLPSIAYGFKSCSQKFKIQPQDKFCNNWQPAKDHWKSGGKITKFIGYDADEPQRAQIYESDKYDYNYPLIEWDLGRDECVEIIKNEGLPLPDKSACFFCPSSKIHEIRNLKTQYPELAARAISMEENAELTSVKGLGRSFAWKDLLSTDDMFDGEYVPEIEMPCGCYDG